MLLLHSCLGVLIDLVAKMFWLGCSWRLLCCCSVALSDYCAVAKVFWVVAKMFLVVARVT